MTLLVVVVLLVLLGSAAALLLLRARLGRGTAAGDGPGPVRVPRSGGQPPVLGPPAPPGSDVGDGSTPPHGFAAQVPPEQAQTPPEGFAAQDPAEPAGPGPAAPEQPEPDVAHGEPEQLDPDTPPRGTAIPGGPT